MNMRFVAVVGLVGALVSGACGGASTGSSGGAANDGGSSGAGAGSGSSCSELADSARQEVDAVLQAHRACVSASDCVGVALSASCFDSCGRAMRKDGEAALQASKAKVDEAQCAQFASKGCKLIIPPCAPPSALACVSGMCTN
jgi:hypothetical protein